MDIPLTKCKVFLPTLYWTILFGSHSTTAYLCKLWAVISVPICILLKKSKQIKSIESKLKPSLESICQSLHWHAPTKHTDSNINYQHLRHVSVLTKNLFYKVPRSFQLSIQPNSILKVSWLTKNIFQNIFKAQEQLNSLSKRFSRITHCQLSSMYSAIAYAFVLSSTPHTCPCLNYSVINTLQAAQYIL